MTNDIAQRLDFLMRITDTRNATLGTILNFDPSYISRIRTGNRGIPRHQPFVVPAARYFAEHLGEPYQRRAVAEAVCGGTTLPEDPADIARILEAWLSGKDAGHNDIEGLLVTLGSPIAPISASLSPVGADGRAKRAGQLAAGKPHETPYYIGIPGKRQAVERFLRELVELDKPVQLLLHSDEDMAWLLDDPAFTRVWASLLGKLALSGSRIVIVHHLDRNIGEMLDAIAKWLPLYLSGAVQPYWCPVVRDNLYRETTFVASGRAAIASRTVGAVNDGMLNLLTHDPEAVAALEAEFHALLQLCRPLMTTEHFDQRSQLQEHLDVIRSGLAAAGNERAILCRIENGTAALLARENWGFELVRIHPPYTVFTVKEHMLVASMWEFLIRSGEEPKPAIQIAAELS